jgi:manganese transport protein
MDSILTNSTAASPLAPGLRSRSLDATATRSAAIDAVRTPSLPEVYRTIQVPGARSWWRRLLAFLGPGYLVSVGYMDPGNWATDIAGGSKFGYTLLSVVLISNLMAILLQSLCVRLGVATGRDLAQACRDYFGRPIGIALWVLCEVAIVACDLAELLGSALALNLLFGIPMAVGVCLTTLDVLVLLWLQNKGFRYTEAIIITLVVTIAGCFALQVVLSQPAWGSLALGLIPRPQILSNPEMLYIAMGILGATVMPHNLYLHSSIVQTRAWGASEEEKRQAIKFGTIDSTAALSIAFFINAAIMVVAAAVFNRAGRFDVADIRDAYQLMSPLLGVAGASTLFAVALLASGQASTLTATLAGQVVMEGFLHIRLPAWLRRLITRLLALIPALITIVWFGEESTGSLLVLSQVVLSLQLSFAVIPLVMFTSDAQRMGAFVAPRWLVRLSWMVAIAIAALNAWLLVQTLL